LRPGAGTLDRRDKLDERVRGPVSPGRTTSPGALHAIIQWRESNGQRKDVSPQGGPKSVMPVDAVTSKPDAGLGSVRPHREHRGRDQYIKELLVTFEGNLTNTVAAYNAGPAAVRKVRRRPSLQETRLYVRRVMDLYRQYFAGRMTSDSG